MSQIHLKLNIVICTILFYLLTQLINEIVFTQSEFTRGINWIYLPAGVRLLCTLLFGAWGAVGLLMASWLISYFYLFPDDFVRAFVGGILSALAPYLVYVATKHVFKLRSSLINLTAARLLICIVTYAMTNALLHHLWFAYQRTFDNFWQGLFAMFTGDLIGAFLVIYTAKAILKYVPSRHRVRSN